MTKLPMRTPPTTTDRQKRRRALWTLAAISVGWKVFVLTVGAAVPRWVLDDGVAAQPRELQSYARDAKATAAGLWNGPIERLGVVRLVKVVSVQRAAPAGEAQRCGGFGARVRAYTYFAVPYSEARMVCDSGVVEYRVFRGLRRAPAPPPGGD